MNKSKVARKKTARQGLGLGFLRGFNWPTRRIVYGPQNKPQPGPDIDNSPEADEALRLERAYTLPVDKLYELGNQRLNGAAETQRELPATLHAAKRRSLTRRDLKILQIIKQGSEGAQYLRELHVAGLRPRKGWIQRGCPGTYAGIATESDPKWLQRAQDEKSKIRRKAELALH